MAINNSYSYDSIQLTHLDQKSSVRLITREQKEILINPNGEKYPGMEKFPLNMNGVRVMTISEDTYKDISVNLILSGGYFRKENKTFVQFNDPRKNFVKTRKGFSRGTSLYFSDEAIYFDNDKLGKMEICSIVKKKINGESLLVSECPDGFPVSIIQNSPKNIKMTPRDQFITTINIFDISSSTRVHFDKEKEITRNLYKAKVQGKIFGFNRSHIKSIDIRSKDIYVKRASRLLKRQSFKAFIDEGIKCFESIPYCKTDEVLVKEGICPKYLADKDYLSKLFKDLKKNGTEMIRHEVKDVFVYVYISPKDYDPVKDLGTGIRISKNSDQILQEVMKDVPKEKYIAGNWKFQCDL